MKSARPQHPSLRISRRKSVLATFFLVIAAAVIPVPFYAVHSSSLADAAKQPSYTSWNSITTVPKSALSLLHPAVAETMATFASDCTTPKSAFTLGETVCAKTDNVDLMFPGGRWVHWLRPNLS